jgi:hypothetical protein
MSEEWYIYKNQAQQGPYTWTQLYQETQAGRILPEDLVWNQNLENWVPASQVPGLIPQVAPVAPPIQVPPPMPASPSPSVAPTPSEGRGLLVAFIAALVVFLGLSGYTVYHFFFSDRGQTDTVTTTLQEIATTLPTTTVSPPTTTAPPTTTMAPTTTTAAPTTTTARPTTTTARPTTTAAPTTTATTAPGITQTTNATWWILD